MAAQNAATEYVLIDFENVQPKNLEIFIDELKQRGYISVNEGNVRYQFGN